MDTSQYWPFAQEHSICSAAVSMPQFWGEDLEPHILSDTIDQVYTAFLYGNQTLLEKILFCHFMTTLNDAYEVELTKEDEGYESRSENFYITTPLCRALRVYHVTTEDDFSFNLKNFSQPPTPLDHAELSPHRKRCHNLTHHQQAFTSSDDESFERSSE